MAYSNTALLAPVMKCAMLDSECTLTMSLVGGGHYSQHKLCFYLIVVLLKLSHPIKELAFGVLTNKSIEGRH